MKKIGILGGTFDPPHIGHFVIANEVRQALNLDEIWFMPVNIPPHKQRANITSPLIRNKMLELGIGDTKYFSVCDIEIKRQGLSYTVETMERLVEQHPLYKFYFIIGGDMVENLKTWYRIEDLLAMVTFVGTNRPGHDTFSEQINKHILELTVPQLEISSSMIRERVLENKSIHFLVPESVREYIKENQLYGSKQSTSHS